MKTIALLICCSALFRVVPAAEAKPAAWTDPAEAAAENPDFLIQGEYTAKNRGLQVAAMGNEQFLISEYGGGLPGAGWDGKDIIQTTRTRGQMKSALIGLKRIERKSPSLGAKPPAGAIVLFDGKDASQWQEAMLSEGLLAAGALSKKEFTDFKIHLEFRLPFKPQSPLSNQDRGNSGVYIFERYETQVIDSFALNYQTDLNIFQVKSDPKQWCGSLYKFKIPDLPMCLPPLVWQTYDIDFTAPKFVDGKKTSNARITTLFNGVKIHDDVELLKGTGAGGKKKEIPSGRIWLQGHGNPVFYRNIWLVEE